MAKQQIQLRIVLKWVLFFWILAGVIIYLLDATLYTTSGHGLFRLSPPIIYSVAVANELLLAVCVVREYRLVIIVSILLQCCLLVAVPALIVSVVPSLLTYAFLLTTIIWSIVFSVLYTSQAANRPTFRLFEIMSSESAVPACRRLSCRDVSQCTHTTRIAKESTTEPKPRHSCQF